MNSIRDRVDAALTQALRCVEHRTTLDFRLENPAYALALGLRYGLVGAAAAHYVLLDVGEEDAGAIRSAAMDWEQHVEAHVRSHVQERIPSSRQPLSCLDVARFSAQALHIYFATCHLEQSLAPCLQETVRIICVQQNSTVCMGWPWYRKRKARAIFCSTCIDSIRMASLFFERRKSDLEEVPEIALLGE